MKHIHRQLKQHVKWTYNYSWYHICLFCIQCAKASKMIQLWYNHEQDIVGVILTSLPSVSLQPYLPISWNSPETPRRRMAISRPRTVIPSQKQTTTRALGRRSRSFLSRRSKCFSPALLYILSEWAIHRPSSAASSLKASMPLSP